MRPSILGVNGCWGVLILVACSGRQDCAETPTEGQSLKEAMNLVCFVDDRANLGGLDDPIEKADRRESYLDDHVRHRDVIYQRTLWKVESAGTRADGMRSLAKQAGLARCPYADDLKADGL